MDLKEALRKATEEWRRHNGRASREDLVQMVGDWALELMVQLHPDKDAVSVRILSYTAVQPPKETLH